MLTKKFMKGAAERAISTFIQTFIAVFAVQIGDVVTYEAAMGLPWQTALVSAALAAMLSVAKALGNVKRTEDGDQ